MQDFHGNLALQVVEASLVDGVLASGTVPVLGCIVWNPYCILGPQAIQVFVSPHKKSNIDIRDPCDHHVLSPRSRKVMLGSVSAWPLPEPELSILVTCD